MGQKHDQSGQTHRPTSLELNDPPPAYRPPLPPRDSSRLSPRLIRSNTIYHSQPLTHSWSDQDPRNLSTESLVPRDTESQHGKRKLLLIYIHGFMGNETSFQSFPAHIHNYVTQKVSGTHVVHTKIYPKYKSRKAIDFARDDFSNW